MQTSFFLLGSRISLVRAEEVSTALGFDTVVRVDARGFAAGGIQALWNSQMIHVLFVFNFCWCWIMLGCNGCAVRFMLVLFLLSMINYGLVSMNYTADVRLDTGVCVVMRTIFPEAFSVLILMRLLSLSHNCQVLEEDNTSFE